MLQGHERSLTTVKYNRDGDLLFTSAKDKTPCVWYSDTGERLGTYKGHTGTVWHLDVNYDSTLLLTGSADNSAKLWAVETGRELFSFKHESPVRAVGFALGDEQFLTVQDNLMGKAPLILLYDLPRNPLEEGAAFRDEVKRSLAGHLGKINHAIWGPLNTRIFSASDDHTVRVWDPRTGKQLAEVKDHKKGVKEIQFSADYGCFITASADNTAKLYDTETLTCLKTYHAERPVNSASISPLMDHIILGGGQEAASVTTTSSKEGKFETRFFDKITEQELGSLKGHFGPINTLAFRPDGRSFASGAEDGFVRLHHFDPDYFAGSQPVTVFQRP